jgi:hypothetical protein
MSESTHPLSFKSLFDEIRQEFGSPDRGFLRTAWKMTTAPGTTLRAIFRGESSEFTRPVRYFLLVFTLYGLVYVSSGAIAIIAADTSRHIAEQLNAAHAARGVATRVSPAEIAKLNPLTYYLQYPLVSEMIVAIAFWLASWPALARMGLNATERLGATLYLYGTFNLLQVPLVVFVFIGQSRALDVALGILCVIYLAWAAHGLADPPRRWTFLRGIAWYFIVQMITGLVFGAAMAKAIYDLDRRESTVAPAAANPTS